MRKVIRRCGEDTVVSFIPAGLKQFHICRREGSNQRLAGPPADQAGDSMRRAAGFPPTPHGRASPGSPQALLWAARSAGRGRGTWGMWRAPGGVSPLKRKRAPVEA